MRHLPVSRADIGPALAVIGRRSHEAERSLYFSGTGGWGIRALPALRTPEGGIVKNLERRVFSLSLVVLSILYGCVAAAMGWFPSGLVNIAYRQAEAILSPHFMTAGVHERAGTRVLQPRLVQPGLTLVASMWRPDRKWLAGLRLLDGSGVEVHRWEVDPTEIFSSLPSPGVRLWSRRIRLSEASIHGVHLFDNGDVVLNLESIGAARLDACGDVLWTLAERNHHSVDLDDDGSFWIPALDYLDDPVTLAQIGDYPGLEAPLIDNRILKVSAEGEVLEDIAMLEVVYRNGLQRYLARQELHTGDILHINDVEVLTQELAEEYPLFDRGDLLVSLRNTSLVLVFDPETLNVKWHVSDPLVHQHDPDFIGGGWIGVFDNARDQVGGRMLGGSRILAFQPHTDSLRVLFPTTESEHFYTPLLGKWQLLGNGNLLLTEGRAGRVLEVDPSGRSVWEWIQERDDKGLVPEVTEGTRYALTPEQVAGWPCAQVGGEEES
jgi:hypothetical protein